MLTPPPRVPHAPLIAWIHTGATGSLAWLERAWATTTSGPVIRATDAIPSAAVRTPTLIEATSDQPDRLAWCARNADHLLVVLDARQSADRRPWEATLRAHGPGTRHLVLLQPEGIRIASKTLPWLEARPGWTHHHVRRGVVEDAHRAMRRVLGRAIGWVLSAASSRGVAHLGVVSALEEARVPADRTVGSSSGSLMALMVSMGMRAEERIRVTTNISFRGRPSKRQLHPPIFAITSGRQLGQVLRAELGDVQLEDLLRPCTMLATDVYRGEMVTLQRGPAWLAMRAAVSLPLYWPPIPWGDHLLVDSGCLELLPIAHLGPECRDGWKIVSDLRMQHDVLRQTWPSYRDEISGWRWWRRRRRSRATSPGPSVKELLLRCLTLPTRPHRAVVDAAMQGPKVAHLVLEVENHPFFGVKTEEHHRHLHDQAYRWTRQALPRWPELPRTADG